MTSKLSGGSVLAGVARKIMKTNGFWRVCEYIQQCFEYHKAVGKPCKPAMTLHFSRRPRRIHMQGTWHTKKFESTLTLSIQNIIMHLNEVARSNNISPKSKSRIKAH